CHRPSARGAAGTGPYQEPSSPLGSAVPRAISMSDNARQHDEADPFDESFQRRLEYLSLVSKRVFGGRTRAERRSRKAGTGVEFADYRQYSAGDDYRYIDWNAYARMGRLLLRLYEEDEDLSVYLLIDRSASMALGHPSKLFYAKRITAALAYVSLAHLDRVAIVGLGEAPQPRLSPTRGRNRIFRVLAFLRSLNPEGGTDLSASLSAFVGQHKRRGLAIVVSDLFDPEHFSAGLDKLRYARFETQVLQITDPRDAAPSLHGDVTLRDAETHELRQVTITPRVLSRYREQYQEHQARVRHYCGDKHIPLLRLPLDVPAEDAVLRMLRRGGVVG
ncbi:MAG: DUF58 domain-containing protein, partial [Myxococcales bacterium]|nr:DUF58 domain-containing protein [Myxococcales bacterium]